MRLAIRLGRLQPRSSSTWSYEAAGTSSIGVQHRLYLARSSVVAEPPRAILWVSAWFSTQIGIGLLHELGLRERAS